MRSRVRTPFFFIPLGADSPEVGVESPQGVVKGREMVGHVVGGGRYLLREKTGHSPDSVHYAAHDFIGGIDVSLDVYPDGTVAHGYRLGTPAAERDAPDLPNLFHASQAAAQLLPVDDAGMLRRILVGLRSILTGREED